MHARRQPPTPSEPLGILGIEAGATRTSACWMDASGQTSGAPASFGPANLKLLTQPQLLQHLRTLAATSPEPAAVGIGMAGTRTEADRSRLTSAAKSVWPRATCIATHDLDTALAASGADPGRSRVLVLSGTGSCCYGRDADGLTARVGGWGHLLGDQGSGFDIGLQALRRAVEAYDLTGRLGPLGQRILAHLHLNEPDQLVGWIHAADKRAIAALAPVVFQALTDRDPLARQTARLAAETLGASAVACARRLPTRTGPTQFIFAGGVLLGQPGFARSVRRKILGDLPGSETLDLRTPGCLGAALLALEAWKALKPIPEAHPSAAAKTPPAHRPGFAPATPPDNVPTSRRLSPTEERHPRSMRLDRMSPGAAIDLMLDEDARIPAAIRREKPRLLRALRLVHRALSSSGRLFYVGAGSSGRLGVLDASECPPTFRTPPEWVQGVIAGGVEAVFRAVEGAEDDFAGGRRAMDFRGVKDRDVVVGIAASGRTPFVWGALAEARRRGAATILVCFNPHLAPGHRPDVVIAPRIGPEVLTGSTRLKAGTATKLILNLLTTLTMVRLGKVVSNLMVDLNPANTKLRERAVRITRELTGADAETARESLGRHRWIVKKAVESLRKTPGGQRHT